MSGHELRLGVVGRHGRGDERGEAVEDVRAAARTHGGGERHTLLDEVPVRLEVLDHPAQRLRAPERAPAQQLDQLGGRQAGYGLVIGVVEQFVEQVLPALVEGQLALQLVEHVEARRQAGLDRELEQDAPGEGVQRADRRMVEVVERGLAQRRAAGLVELGADAVAQLGSGLLGEGDGGDGVDGHPFVDRA